MHQLKDKKKKIGIYIIFLFILSTTSGKYIENNDFFKIDEISITGLSNNKNLQISNELNNFYHKNILLLKKGEISEIINKHNIIEKYTIKKIYPSILNIDIKPTEVVARISGNNQLLVGANGKLIPNKENNKILKPYIFGEFNSKKFLKFKKNINSSKFHFDDFKIVYFFPSNRWDILTTDDILIKLPEKNLFNSLNLAYKIISNDQFKDQKIIDLRVNNHLVVK